MTTDGGLSALFQKFIPDAHWQRIETWSTGQGVPDLNYCLDGVEGWIELKAAAAWVVEVRPEQVAWIERRVCAGGNVLIAVRKQAKAGSRRVACDELHVYRGEHVRAVAEEGLRVPALLVFTGGRPGAWDWAAVRAILLKQEPTLPHPEKAEPAIAAKRWRVTRNDMSAPRGSFSDGS